MKENLDSLLSLDCLVNLHNTMGSLGESLQRRFLIVFDSIRDKQFFLTPTLFELDRRKRCISTVAHLNTVNLEIKFEATIEILQHRQDECILWSFGKLPDQGLA